MKAKTIVLALSAVFVGAALAESDLNLGSLFNPSAEGQPERIQVNVRLKPVYDRYLGVHESQFMKLGSEYMADLKNKSAMMREESNAKGIKEKFMKFSCTLDFHKGMAAKYGPMFSALRAETAKKVVPQEIAELKDSLLAKMDQLIKVLDRIEELDVGDLVDSALASGKGSETDSAVRDCLPVALSILPNFEFPDKGKNVCGIRVNLVGGSHVDVSWVDVGTVFNSVSGKFNGFQLAGLCNVGSSTTKGIQLSGIINGSRTLTGLQGAVGINFAGEVVGIQVSGLANVNFKMHGCQIACSGNYATIGKGCQIGCNNVSEKMRGIQFGALLNAGNDFEGFQLSAINWASRCRGLQMGIVNYADAMSGCQIGLCNIIKTSAVPFLPVVNMNF